MQFPDKSDTRLHKALVRYKKDIADYKSKLREAQNRPYYNPRYNKPENEPEFFKKMSDECMPRAIAILDTVFKAIESLGGSINSDLSVIFIQFVDEDKQFIFCVLIVLLFSSMKLNFCTFLLPDNFILVEKYFPIIALST
mgnify:CR=1 FL=1